MQTLGGNEMRVLRAIEDGGVMRGNKLRREARVKSRNDFVAAVQRLAELELIAFTGDVSDEKSVLSAHFRPVPSARGMAKRALEQKF